jgi:hypothetical protein
MTSVDWEPYFDPSAHMHGDERALIFSFIAGLFDAEEMKKHTLR